MSIKAIFVTLHAYWNERTFREKWILQCGLVFVLFILIYSLIWSPLHHKNETLRSTIDAQQALLVWMEKNTDLVKQSRIHNNHKNNTKEIFTIIEGIFKNTTIVRLSQSQVSVTFKDMPFDELMRKLLLVHNDFNIQVTEIQINITDKPGIIEGKVILSLIA